MKHERMPIGVFDSGIGGLTVLKELIKTLPDEDIIYLGDTARLPYGTKSEETVIKYSVENTRFLLKYNIKLLVVACNTASAASLSVLRKEFHLPMTGVIEAGARAAARATNNGRIGVIGTETTIRSSAYTKAIKSVNPAITVIGQPCPLFVPLVEEGWFNGDITISVAERYLTSLRNEGVDTLVLGCTHYPLLKVAIQKVMGDSVKLIDSAEETAAEVREALTALGLINSSGDTSVARLAPVRRYFVTDVPVRFEEQGSRFLGEKITSVEKVEVG